MSSFFGKLKTQNPTSPTSTTSPTRKDPNAPIPTPLERMLMNAGPIRNDGSDKFFGMENFGNTCYCNSILQCLYYSVPFREHVLTYPQKSTKDAIAAAAATAPPRPPYNPNANGAAKKPPPNSPTSRNASGQQQQQQKPEDKDSPEYKKKQALLAGPILNMSYQNAGAYKMPESLFTSLKDIFEAVVVNQSRNGVISPSKFLEVLRKENEMFRSAMHQDAHEFLNLLLNAVVENIEIHETTRSTDDEGTEAQEPEKMLTEDGVDPLNGEISKTESASVSFPPLLPTTTASSPTRWLHELFEGTLTSETRCLTCENTSQRDEPFLDLSVDLEQHSSVTACLRRFSEEEMLCERNKFHCDNCGGLQEAEKRMKIKRLPRILALHLKRFKYTEDLQRLQKLFHKVVYPYHLRLFNTTDDAEDPDRLYELYAVVVHIGGGPYHGHYVAIIKTQDRGWLLFDDEMVEPVDQSYVKNFFGDRPGLACAYVLFYQETTLEAVQKEQRMDQKRRAQQSATNGLTVATNDSAELHRIHTVIPAASPHDTSQFVSLDHAVTAPQFRPNGHVEPPKSPPTPGQTPLSPMSQSRKERAREEKERKAAEKLAEKERQAAEKQKRKDIATKLADAHKKQEADLKAALEASKLSKAEEDKRIAFEKGENAQPNGSNGSGLEKFKRSKSLRFGSLKKDRQPSVLAEDAVAPLVGSDDSPEKDKKSRFSLRKKSFGML